MRATTGTASKRRHRKYLKQAKGMSSTRRRLIRNAIEAVRKGMMRSWAHRRKKKNDFRGLWISRIKIASTERGMSYSKFMDALNKADVKLNRKMLSEIAVNDSAAFDKVFELAK